MLARKPLGARDERRGAPGDSASGAGNCDGLSSGVAAFALASRSATALPGLDVSGALAVRVGLHAEVADDVAAHLFSPVLRDLRQPGGAVLRAGAAFNVGIPGAQSAAVVFGVHGAGQEGVNQ